MQPVLKPKKQKIELHCAYLNAQGTYILSFEFYICFILFYGFILLFSFISLNYMVLCNPEWPWILCCSGWSWTGSLAFTLRMLRLQAWATTSSLCSAGDQTRGFVARQAAYQLHHSPSPHRTFMKIKCICMCKTQRPALGSWSVL